MTGRLLAFFLAFHFAAAAASATNITTSGPGGSRDTLAELRGMAGLMLREGQGGDTTLSEGEELVSRPGGGRSGPSGPDAMREGLSRIGSAVNLNELPDLVREISQGQADAARRLQADFGALAGARSVTEEERAVLLKNIERQLDSIRADQMILQGLRQKVETALADPGLPAEQKTTLTQYARMVNDSMSGIQRYQGELAKMGRSGQSLRTSSPGGTGEEVERAVAETAQVWEEVDALVKEAQGQPSGLSQDFFHSSVDTINEALKKLDELMMKVNALLEADPKSQEAISLLKRLSDYRTQAGKLLRDFSVVEVQASVITEAQDVADQLGEAVAALKNRLAALKARDKEEVSKEEIEALFAEYDRVAALAEKGRKLGVDVARSASAGKYETAEQAKMRELLAEINAEFDSLGADGESLAPWARAIAWAEYLKEEEEAADGQLELGDDVNSGTLDAAPSVASRLNGAVIADVLKKDSVYYGAALMNRAASSIGEGEAADYASLKRADLVVFKVENGRYTSVNLGSFQVYDGAAHAALAINASGELAVFLNHTLVGDKTMSGEFFTLDPATLARLASHTLDLAQGSGRFPRFAADGALLNLLTDAGLDEYRCSDAACDLMSPVSAGLFASETEALRAWHSLGLYSRDDYSGDLPTGVLAGRLSGETRAEELGAYSHLSWGRWNDGAGVADTIHTNSYWLAGTLTPAAEVPATGSASYTGELFGKATEAGTISAVTGTTALTADFAARTLTGTFDMNKNDVHWTNAAVNAAWGAGTNSVSGSLTADNNLKGAVSGGFFGPAAVQVGGTWNLGNNSDIRAAGVFTAEQPAAQ